MPSPNRAAFTRDEMERVLSPLSVSGEWQRTVGVTTDSRAANNGTLFVALRGETFDGHNYVASAIQRGASAVLVDRDVDNVPHVRVLSTLTGLSQLAHAHRSKFNKPVVGITGSAGKTTTKSLVSAMLLHAIGPTLTTESNFNNRVGVPLTVLQLDSLQHQAAVIEMGTSERGEIAALASVVQSTVGIVTLVAAGHTAGIGSIDDVADEKIQLLQTLPRDGVAVYFGDDNRLRERAHSISARRTVTFGIGDKNDVQLVSTSVRNTRNHAQFRIGSDVVSVPLQLWGEGAARSAAAALAAAVGMGLDLKQAVEGLAMCEPIPGRMHVRTRSDGLLVIDDTYNANPASMRASLQSLASLRRGSARLVAVLGDMGELGEYARASHERVADTIAELGVDSVVFCGEEMKAATDRCRDLGVSATWVSEPDNRVVAALAASLGAKDAVLVKGSRFMRMERAVNALLSGQEREGANSDAANEVVS